ncbi:MAG: hypothetical protein C0412_05965 [Flavobacterium sp.]|jgi:hypothetical protein|nr:hypothetical protein [Flavobacterium sp.]
MCIIPLTEIRNVTNITAAEKERIYDFLKGALLYWCKNKPEEWFMGRDFLSGKKFDWNGTPLIVKKIFSIGVKHSFLMKELGKIMNVAIIQNLNFYT